MKSKSKWPDEPETGEVFRRLNWFMEVGFIVDFIDISNWQEQISMTGDCRPDDIGMEYTEGGPFRITFRGVRNFSMQNLHQTDCDKRLILKGPREFTKEKDLSKRRYYHLKTSTRGDAPGFEIDFDEVDIQPERRSTIGG